MLCYSYSCFCLKCIFWSVCVIWDKCGAGKQGGNINEDILESDAREICLQSDKIGKTFFGKNVLNEY